MNNYIYCLILWFKLNTLDLLLKNRFVDFMKYYPLLLLFILVFSCKSKLNEKEIIEKHLTIEETIQSLLSEEYQEALKIDDEGRNLLYTFYENRGFKPLWSTKDSLNEIGTNLQQLVLNPIQFGLPEKRFDLNWSKEQALQNEIVIVCGLARIYKDLQYGLLDSSMTKLKPVRYVPLESMDTLLDFSQKNYAQKIISWGPIDSTYQALANSLYEFVNTNNLKEEKVELKTAKEDTINTLPTVKNILLKKNYLDSSMMNDSLTFIKALKKFQSENGSNPDGVIGKETVYILTETNLHKAQRIALEMEKQRRKKSYPKRYIYINIPEYMLRVYNEDTLCSENRIVVGKYENQTPELTSQLHSIIVYPFWNVPYSIASKEILPAAQANSNYFERNDMVLLKNKDTINPSRVNWKKIKKNTFPYKIMQQPGPRNSLGIIKFEFHNKYDVYFHDTPSKGLFTTVARTYSHGCMRTENPTDLAKVVLELDENPMTADSLDSLLLLPLKQFPIRLKKRIPIFIEYNSIIVTNNKAVILRDVYHRDDKYIQALFGES